MYIDSQIVEKVLLYFAHRDVPVLALHDGFRVDARLFDELKRVMHEIIYVNFKRLIRLWVISQKVQSKRRNIPIL